MKKDRRFARLVKFLLRRLHINMGETLSLTTYHFNPSLSSLFWRKNHADRNPRRHRTPGLDQPQPEGCQARSVSGGNRDPVRVSPLGNSPAAEAVQIARLRVQRKTCWRDQMSTMRSLRRQSMYGDQWKSRRVFVIPDQLTTRQKVWLLLNGLFRMFKK